MIHDYCYVNRYSSAFLDIGVEKCLMFKHVTSHFIWIEGITPVKATSLFSVNTKTEFMTKLWINKEPVLQMIRMCQEAVDVFPK